MKKVLSFILVLSMVLGSFGMAFAAPAETGKTAIDKMVELGFVKGDEGTGDLRLNDTIKRSEVAAIVTRVLGLEALANSSNYQGRFADVTPIHWANGSINVAAGRSLVNGYPNGTFAPEGVITNNEAVTIMVRMLLDAKELEAVDKSGVWPANYLVKAAELGILEGTNITNYGEAATRENVFTMAYNAYENQVAQDLYVVKALVLENERVERIGENEVVVEVIEEVQKAEFAEKSRKEKGDQLKLDLPEGYDTEDLLGKVVDLALDKSEKVVKLTVDESYKVETGAIKAEKNKLTVGTKSYTVSLGERYKQQDDRVFRTYFNNKPYSYEEFYQDVTDKKDTDEFKADYGRVTIKNGKVVFIDSFKFDDIAPVKEVKEDGAEVLVYRDSRDGAVKKFELKTSTVVVAVKEGNASKATRKDIAVNDVIHAYDGGFIVRKDAAVNGTFEKVSEARNGDVFVHVDEKEYKVLTADNKKPVYSYDSKDFYTLNADRADSVLKEFRGEKVTALLDLSGNLQYIGSEIELGEFVGIVTKVVGKEIRVLKADGKTADYVATLDTKVVVRDKDTGHKNLNELNAGDLVYLSVDEDKIDTVTLLTRDYKDREKNEVKEAKPQVVKTFDARDIVFEDVMAENDGKEGKGKEFRILSDTTIFVKTVNGYEVRTAKDVKDAFDKNVKDNKDVKAYVISGERFDRVAEPIRDVYTSGKAEAHTVVFTQIEIKSDLDKKIVEFNGFADRQEKEMKIINADGGKEELTVDRKSDVPAGLKGGDILEIELTKDDKKVVKSVTRLIEARDKDEVFYVVNLDGQGNLKLRDRNIDEETFYVERKTPVFGGSLGNADNISFVLDTDKYVKAVLVRGKDDKVTGSFTKVSAGVDGRVTRVIEDKNRVYFEITEGLKVKEYEVAGLALTLVKEIKEEKEENFKNADIKMIVKNNKIVGFEHIRFNSDLTADFTIPKAFEGLVISGNKTIAGDITVNADNVKMKDITVTGTVTLADGIKTFTAEGTNFDTLTINGGGSNSIHLTDATVKSVVVNKKGVRVEMVNTTVTGKVTVNVEAKVEAKGTTKVNELKVEAANVELVQGKDAVVTEITGSKKDEMKYDSAINAKNSSVTKAVYNSEKGEFTVEFEVKDQAGVAVKDIRKANVKVEVKNEVVDMSEATFDNVKEADKVVDGKYVVTFKKTDKIETTGTVKVTVKDVVIETKDLQDNDA